MSSGRRFQPNYRRLKDTDEERPSLKSFATGQNRKSNDLVSACQCLKSFSVVYFSPDVVQDMLRYVPGPRNLIVGLGFEFENIHIKEYC